MYALLERAVGGAMCSLLCFVVLAAVEINNRDWVAEMPTLLELGAVCCWVVALPWSWPWPVHCRANGSRDMNALTVKHDPVAGYLPLSLGVLWLWSGLQPLLTATQTSLDLLADLGVPDWGQWPLLLAASLLDLLFGVCSLLPATRRRAALWAWQLATVAAYSLLIAVGLPENWLHPFAPLLKNLPIMALMFYLYRRCAAHPGV